MNLLFWGGEALLLSTTLKNKLEVFSKRHSRRILRISMFQVKDGRIRQLYFRKIFYNIPCVESMILARELLFIGKVFQDPSSYWPAKMVLTKKFNHSRPEQVGRSQYHDKETIVSNLCLLFKKVHEVHIYPRYGTLNDCTNEARNERYRNQLI